MENYDLRYGEDRYAVASSPASVRAAFVRRTYGHVLGAILAFVAGEALLFKSGLAEEVIRDLFSTRFGMLFVMLGFIGGGYVAQAMARSATSDFARYMGLSLYVGLEIVIFLPLLYIAQAQTGDHQLAAKAGIVTLTAFAGLTLAVFLSRADFSFLGPVLGVLSFAALGLVIASLIFGFTLGTAFAAAMVALAGGYIVYTTSNIVHHYRPDQHVAAALELFAAVALMFWYVLRLFLGSRSND